MRNPQFGIILLAVIAYAVVSIAKVIGMILAVSVAVALLAAIVQFAVESVYFNGKTFASLKDRVSSDIRKCNELNAHIEELKTLCFNYRAEDFGQSDYTDGSCYHFKRPNFHLIHNNTDNEYFCSLSVCRNASIQPFKYFCKYFGVGKDEETLSLFENVLNDFLSVEEGRRILMQDRSEFLEKYGSFIPYTIRKFRKKRLFEELGYDKVELSSSHFPKYSFKYISAGGNSSLTCDIVFDIENLNKFVEYLFNQVELSRTIKYQRALLTDNLREAIKMRDNFTCRMCGISVHDEPHLLLEIDHVIPLSKGGKTTMDNLQTLCWRCNRQKGSKIMT